MRGTIILILTLLSGCAMFSKTQPQPPTPVSKDKDYAINSLEFYPDEDYVNNMPVEVVVNGW